MPLWLSAPALVLLGTSSWISTLDPTGSSGDNYLLWAVTAITAALLVLRLARLA